MVVLTGKPVSCRANWSRRTLPMLMAELCGGRIWLNLKWHLIHLYRTSMEISLSLTSKGIDPSLVKRLCTFTLFFLNNFYIWKYFRQANLLTARWSGATVILDEGFCSTSDLLWSVHVDWLPSSDRCALGMCLPLFVVWHCFMVQIKVCMEVSRKLTAKAYPLNLN